LLIPDFSNPLTIPSELRSNRSHDTFYLGVALAQVDTEQRTITLDLVNTFPERDDFDTLDSSKGVENTPEKLDLGMLSLWLQDPCTHHKQWLGNIPFMNGRGLPAYDTAVYLLTSGIVEIPYDPDMESAILEGDLVLRQGTDTRAPILLREN